MPETKTQALHELLPGGTGMDRPCQPRCRCKDRKAQGVRGLSWVLTDKAVLAQEAEATPWAQDRATVGTATQGRASPSVFKRAVQ